MPHGQRYPFDPRQYRKYLSHHSDKRDLEARHLTPLFVRWLRGWDEQRDETDIHALDVGCATGSLALKALRECETKVRRRDGAAPRQLHLTLLDPNGPDLAEAASLFTSESFESCGVEVRDVCAKLEHLPRAGMSGCFDVILCSHVLYYVANWRSAIDLLMGLLSPHGTLVVILASSAGTIFTLREKCLQQEDASDRYAEPYYGEDLSRVLEDASISHRVTRCRSEIGFSADSADAEVADVLSFLYHCAPGTCLNALQNEASGLWLETSRNGMRLASYEDVVFEIRRSSETWDAVPISRDGAVAGCGG